ncbi:serine hydrolase [Carboxydochorda subterranea]|uniref:Serine hydrolase n=1 Tax=Carboxydichorda subterranea TaxID=3109565 RepID=A0ABZ1BWF2_9FIRM|nr:serine hydrolase [Limnochorda sp. L945t]WRP16462.1 serine hydrolase [Limnochorda sp. L945t]
MTRQDAIQQLEALEASFSGTIGVAASWLGAPGESPAWAHVPALRALGEGRRPGRADQPRDGAEPLRYRAREPFAAASVIKLPILCEVWRQARAGRLSLGDRIRLTAEDQVGGSGVLKDLTPGLELSVRDLAVLMISVSDNTATNMLIDRIGGPEPVNAFAAQLGLEQTLLAGKLQVRPEQYGPLQRKGLRSTTSPEDMARLLALLHRAAVPGLSEGDHWEILDILTRQQHLPSIGRYLPFDPDSVEDREPVGAVVGSKSGSIRGVRNDVGIVWTPAGAYAIALMSRDCRDLRFHPENEAEVVLGRAGLVVYRYFVGEASAA